MTLFDLSILLLPVSLSVGAMILYHHRQKSLQAVRLRAKRGR